MPRRRIMILEVSVRRLPEGLPGGYTEFVANAPPGLLLSCELSYEEQEALEVEARCYRIRGPRARRKFCYTPRSLEEMDRERIKANDTYKIIAYSGVPPYPAVAILQNMKARGELPEE